MDYGSQYNKYYSSEKTYYPIAKTYYELKINNNNFCKKMKKADIIRLSFYIIEEEASDNYDIKVNSTDNLQKWNKLTDGIKFTDDSYIKMNKGSGAYSLKYSLGIICDKEKTTNTEHTITVDINKGAEFKIKIVIPPIAGEEEEETESVRTDIMNQGFIKDTHALKLQKEGDSKNNLIHGFNKGTSANEKIDNFINSYGIKNQIKDYLDNNGKALDKNAKLQKYKTNKKEYDNIYGCMIGFIFKSTKKQTVYNFHSASGNIGTEGTYIPGEVWSNWKEKELEKNEEYEVVFTFRYFRDRNEILYRVTYAKAGSNEALETQQKANEDTDNVADESAERTESKIKRRIKLAIASVEGGASREELTANYVFVDVLTNTDDYSKFNSITEEEAKKVEDKAGKIVAVVTNIGMVLSIVIPAILGVKYMIGSVDEKAEYKKDIVPYLVGATLLFSICTVVKILQYMGEQINKI